MLMTGINMKIFVGPKKIQQIPYIQYLVQFKEKKVQVFIDFFSKINAISPTYGESLKLYIVKPNIKIQKNKISISETYGVILTVFSPKNKL